MKQKQKQREQREFYAVRVLIAEPVEDFDEDGEAVTAEPVCEWVVAPGEDGVIDTVAYVCTCKDGDWAVRIRDLLNAEDRSLAGRIASLTGEKVKP